MTETIHERWARQERQGHAIAAFLRAGPHEPRATRAEVLEVPCPVCEARPGEECGTAFPRAAWAAGIAFGSAFSGVHLRRYLDKTGDPR